ncbi:MULTISPECIES: MFS transporter [unclassified Sphingomonas]|uniref:MFS transporter n=1 Tax=unclassified Sphingomonas TaxID=196159 RepID=UPI000E10A036|nr:MULTISPECIES: MFS transporter [unclassified Sphingomonas]AXJ96956.1 MFS transporter [Sphingomonas sp. FARSPH]
MSSDPATTASARARRLFRLSLGNYFMGGFIISLISLLVPRLKLLMGLDYFQASLVQLAFHSSYLLFALPITAWIVAIGYMRGLSLGLAVMALGCAGLAGAAAAGSYPLVLVALLTLSAGVTFLQLAGGIVFVVVEDGPRAVSRLTLVQGFNSLGTVLAPLLGASFLLGSASTGPSGWVALALPFLASAAALASLAIAFFGARRLLDDLTPPRRVPLAGVVALLRDPRLLAGSAAMFAYVGAEVTIGSLLANFLVRGDVLAVPLVTAGRLVSLYWAGAMIGRFVGAAAFARIAPSRALAGTAIAAALLVAVAIGTPGAIGAAALLAVGLCNAIMYPTIFALSLPDDAEAAPYASMALCMAVVGGAVVPVLTGRMADAIGLRAAFSLSLVCYLVIAAFAYGCITAWPRSEPAA